MMHRFFFNTLLSLVLFCSGVISAQGATDDFIIRTLVGGDTTPPTVPGSLVAIPVATSQINLSWATSTDDFLLSGYQVFRDGVQIATTTATNYTDVGLTVSTTYAYYVTAFDSFSNVSASSTVVSTTTLSSTTPSVEEPAATSSTSYGSISRLALVRLEVIPEQEGVLIRYETRGYVRSVIRWGKTISYELGSLAERSFSKVHETKITGLTPNTTYKFIIEGENNIGVQGVLTESVFVTLPPEDVIPPGNVQNLRATKEGDDIVLSWINPLDVDFDHLRILRSEQFYPSDLADGWVVYEGAGETTHDVGMAVEGTRQFYTVFTYDKLGNVSSGAVVSIRIEGGTTTPVVIPPDISNPIALTFTDFAFIQDGESQEIVDNRVTIDGSKQLLILLPYDRVPEHLKTILVTLTDAEGKEFAFLLRINEAKTGYTAVLAPFGVSGTFSVRISVFDFKTTQIGYVHGDILSRIAYVPDDGGDMTFLGVLFSTLGKMLTSYFFWFVLILILLLEIGRRALAHEPRAQK